MQYYQVLTAINQFHELAEPARWKATLAMQWTRIGARRLFVLKRSHLPGMLPINGKRRDFPAGDTERELPWSVLFANNKVCGPFTVHGFFDAVPEFTEIESFEDRFAFA